VKQYILKRTTIKNQVLAEIRFLRELFACENIITLESVFRNEEKYHLVLKYAEEGSLRDFMFKNVQTPLSETDIR